MHLEDIKLLNDIIVDKDDTPLTYEQLLFLVKRYSVSTISYKLGIRSVAVRKYYADRNIPTKHCDLNTRFTEEELANEVWKDIGNTGRYQVSNIGRVRSVSGYVYRSGKPFFVEGKLLTVREEGTLILASEKKSKHLKVADLVAEAFIPNPLNLKYVKQLDGNRSNSRVTNLVWSATPDTKRCVCTYKKPTRREIKEKMLVKSITSYAEELCVPRTTLVNWLKMERLPYRQSDWNILKEKLNRQLPVFII